MKRSFSKKLLLADYIIFLVLIAILLIFIKKGYDTSSLSVVVGAWIAQIAVSSGFYYWKAKAENLVKMPIYMLERFPEDMKDKADPNQIVSSVLGIGHIQ